MNWIKIGMLTVPYLASIILSVIIVIVSFRRWIAPGIIEALEMATKTTQTLASLGGIKKQDWHDTQELEAVITKELIMNKMPELQMLKLALTEPSWEQVEEMIEENPKVALQLYEKYKPLLGGAKQKQEEYMF